MRIIEGFLIDGENIFVGVLLAGNLSDTLKGFTEIVRNRNPRRAAIGGGGGHGEREERRCVRGKRSGRREKVKRN